MFYYQKMFYIDFYPMKDSEIKTSQAKSDSLLLVTM